jgi:endonuclease/exonuclease/phosphatase family metal-dependent hydrolase
MNIKTILTTFLFLSFCITCSADLVTQDADVVNVMTFNIRVSDAPDTGNRHWTKRRPYVENIINQKISEAKLNELTMIDFVGLQEANWAEINIFNQTVSGNQQHTTKGNMGYVNFGESVKLFYRCDRWVLNNFGVFEIGSDQWGRRIVGWAHFLDMNAPNRGVYVLNSHWPVHGNIKGERVTDWIANRAEKKHPVIMMGDFNNASSDHAFFHNSDRNVDLISVYSKLSNPVPKEQLPALGTHSHFTNSWTGSRIDHIFVSSEKMKGIAYPLQIKHAEIIHYPSQRSGDDKAIASDHFPLFVQLKFGS